jgi:hypothetical protein
MEAEVAGRRHLTTLLGGAVALAALVGGSALYGAARITPCDTTTEVTASAGDSMAVKGPGLDRLTIVLVGDAGFNASDAAVDAKGVHKGKAVTPFTDVTSGIAKDIDGDLAFVDLETVVTDRNDLQPEKKGGDEDAPFHFRSHPAAVKALIDLGFNLFSLANNASISTARTSLSTRSASSAATPRSSTRPTTALARRPIAAGPTSRQS